MPKLNKNLIAISSLAIFVSASLPAIAREPTTNVAVGAQYDTTHVYVAPSDVDAFVRSFTATFGGASTRQGVATVTPTPSSTSTQLVQTPAGTVSLFGFRPPIPWPFGTERRGWLVTDIDEALRSARAAGAEVIVAPFPDPIGRDAVIQWPGGVNMQLYWHTTKPDYAPFTITPENRFYVSSDRADSFVRSFSKFSNAKLLSDDRAAPGVEIGRPDTNYRRIRLTSAFGPVTVLVTDGHLPYPYGHDVAGYGVTDLPAALARATGSGAKLLIAPYASAGRTAAMVAFPGGYIAEIHAAQ